MKHLIYELNLADFCRVRDSASYLLTTSHVFLPSGCREVLRIAGLRVWGEGFRGSGIICKGSFQAGGLISGFRFQNRPERNKEYLDPKGVVSSLWLMRGAAALADEAAPQKPKSQGSSLLGP